MEGESTPVAGDAPQEPALEVDETSIDSVADPSTTPTSAIRIALDALRLRDEAFAAAVARTDLKVPALVAATVSILTTSIAGWLYLRFDDFGTLSSGRIIFREVVVGSVLMMALWLAWVLIVEALLKRRGFDVDRGALVRSMGFACVPLVASLLMVVPILAFGAGLIAIALWVMASDRAIAAAVPASSASERNVANLLGFGVLALVLGGIAFQTGMAPGPFVFIGLWELVR